jgi:hypothetical protein
MIAVLGFPAALSAVPEPKTAIMAGDIMNPDTTSQHDPTRKHSAWLL